MTPPKRNSIPAVSKLSMVLDGEVRWPPFLRATVQKPSGNDVDTVFASAQADAADGGCLGLGTCAPGTTLKRFPPSTHSDSDEQRARTRRKSATQNHQMKPRARGMTWGLGIIADLFLPGLRLRLTSYSVGIQSNHGENTYGGQAGTEAAR